MVADSHRLSILSDQEIDDLYGFPRFTEEDRRLYFDLSTAEKAAAGAIRTASVAVYLILELGYFKAKRQFFALDGNDIADDMRFVLAAYFPGRAWDDIKMPSRPTRGLLQKTILELCDYRACGPNEREEIESKGRRIAMISAQPIFILREILQHLESSRIIAPSYSTLQDIVGRVVAGERTRITQLLADTLTPAIEARLTMLLDGDEQLHTIGTLKREAKDFSYGELREEVARREFFAPLHEFASQFLETAGISQESGKYYASLVKFYTIYKLQRMQTATARLYLLCFAFHRFRQINDNLIEAFIYLVDQYEKQAKTEAEAAMQKALEDALANLRAAGQVLGLFVDNSIAPDAPFSAVREKAFALLDREQFPIVASYLRKIEFDKVAFEWAYYRSLSHTFKRNLRQLFSTVEFAGRIENAPLLDAVAFLQDCFARDKSPRQLDSATFPSAVIPKNLQRYLFVPSKQDRRKRTLDPDRYEFLVYRQLRNALEAGDIYVRNSTEFRRFEDDLISDDKWANKDALLRELNLPLLSTPIEDTLAAFHESIESRLERVNRRIDDGENKHNVLDRYVKHDADPKEILACIVAMGTNMGLWKMAEVSGLSHSALLNAARNFLRPETLRLANDAIAKLPAFHLFDIAEEMHSSSDGQRIETQTDTMNARHSPKYFGLKKGVSSYTLVANHVPINARIIGTHEHESHYVFDLLYNNTSEIKPERHSTDTHGTNQVNFIILRTFGHEFAPRHKNLPKQAESLIGFQHPNQYSDFLIRPCRKVLDELIIEEWPNVQRILVSLAQKEVTQSTIIRKLSSYRRQNRTKRALWELDNLCFTEYILKFIDDPELRKNVQKALNRGEAYHRFRRAVAFVNGGKFRVKTEEEQHIWNECSRLTANAIIYYNTLLLSRVYEQKLAAGDQDAVELMRGISPIAWQHINLFGTFEFSPAEAKLDIDALVAIYADSAYWSKALAEEVASSSAAIRVPQKRKNSVRKREKTPKKARNRRENTASEASIRR